MESQEFLEWPGTTRCRGFHSLLTVYDRPWRRMFRKRWRITCARCGLEVAEPPWLSHPVVMQPGDIMARPRG